MKTVNENVLKFLADAPLFFQPWWLEAVSPDAWDYVVVRRGEEVAAVLPYTFKMRLGRLRLIEMPFLTPYLGPWLRQSNAKYANRLGEEKDLMTELIDGLPRFATFKQDFHPTITNWLPFFWKGFRQTTRYTYRTDETKDLEALWSETRDNVRTDVKKARKTLEVRETEDFDQFLPLHRMTFARQGRGLPYSEDKIRELDRACAAQNARKMFLATEPGGRAHAVIYLLHDCRHVYYFFSGSDPEVRSSGAISLLVWHAITWALSMGKQFDFEGSMAEPIERAFRSFGARQTPYLQVEKNTSNLVRLYRALRS